MRYETEVKKMSAEQLAEEIRGVARCNDEYNWAYAVDAAADLIDSQRKELIDRSLQQLEIDEQRLIAKFMEEHDDSNLDLWADLLSQRDAAINEKNELLELLNECEEIAASLASQFVHEETCAIEMVNLMKHRKPASKVTCDCVLSRHRAYQDKRKQYEQKCRKQAEQERTGG